MCYTTVTHQSDTDCLPAPDQPGVSVLCRAADIASIRNVSSQGCLLINTLRLYQFYAYYCLYVLIERAKRGKTFLLIFLCDYNVNQLCA